MDIKPVNLERHRDAAVECCGGCSHSRETTEWQSVAEAALSFDRQTPGKALRRVCQQRTQHGGVFACCSILDPLSVVDCTSCTVVPSDFLTASVMCDNSALLWVNNFWHNVYLECVIVQYFRKYMSLFNLYLKFSGVNIHNIMFVLCSCSKL